jgi:dienelactone hydrolase
LVLAAAAACDTGDDDGVGSFDAGAPIADASAANVRALYALRPGALPFGSVPWPDDAYLDAQGRLSVRDIPTADADYAAQLATALNDLDGFGVRPVVFVRFDGAIDPASLPDSPAESLEPRASVFLLDADTSSSTAFERIPVEVSYAPARFELRLRPAYGRNLVPGRRYAAVVTDRLMAANGTPVEPGERFAAIRDRPILASSLERAARARYNPVLQTLAREGLARRSVVALAVFHVQSARADLDSVHALLDARPVELSALTLTKAGPELDLLFGTPPPTAVGIGAMGAPHDQVGFVARGSLVVPSLLGATPAEHGQFGRGPAGQLLIRGAQDVFFSIWLPRVVMMDAPLPLVVVAHDMNGERSDAAALANVLAGAGFAVIAADAPFHGLRAGTGDTVSRFTKEARSDGFGDAPGDFIGERDEQGELSALHPFYFRDAVRQAAADTMALLKAIRADGFEGIKDLAPELAGLRFDTAHVGYVGIGLGADVGAIVAPFEPEVSGFVLAFGGGTGVDGWFAGPEQSGFAAALLARLGHAADANDDPTDPPALWPDVDVFRTLTDRASPFAYAGLLRRAPANALLLLARDDENVANRATEALAYALGAVVAGGEPRHELALESVPLSPGAPLSANFPAEGGDVTRALFVVEPATHRALMLEQDTQRFEQPLSPPFTPRAKPVEVRNPTAALIAQIAFWFGSVRMCPASNVKMPCAASLQAPQTPQSQ